MTNKIKNVPELRFPGFSGEWKEKRLGDIATTFSGGTPSSTDRTFYNGSISFIRSGEISKISTELKINEKAISKSSAKMVEVGDLLYALYGATSGEVAISKINGAINQAVLCIRSKESILYLFNYLTMKKGQILNTYIQGGQGNLSANIVKRIQIKLPCLFEQQKIGDFFSKLDRQIELEEQKLSLLEEQKKGYMQKIFSQELRFKDDNGKDYPAWEIKKLGDLYKYQQGQQIPVENQYKIQINNMKRFIRIVDVTENPKKRYIKDRKESGLINQKDLIMIRYGASAGTISMGYEGVIANNLFKFVKKQNVDNRYFYFLLKKSHFKIKSLSSQSAMPALNFNAMDTLKFSIPQYSEQQKIGGFFSELDKLVEKQNQKIDGLKERKKGFLQKMFV